MILKLYFSFLILFTSLKQINFMISNLINLIIFKFLKNFNHLLMIIIISDIILLLLIEILFLEFSFLFILKWAVESIMQRLTPIKRKPNQEQTAIDEIRTSGASVIQKHLKILLDARKLKNSVKTYRSLEDGSALQYAKNKRLVSIIHYLNFT